MRRVLSLSVCGILALAMSGRVAAPVASAGQDKVDEAALKRARKQVRMLDDIYKTAIVLITEKYVQTKKDYPAGRAAIRWLNDIAKKGHPEARLIDVSGEPYTPTNVAKDDFEKEGVKQLKAGKDYFERVEQKGGKPHLRAMTAVPVVMERCILCHENYRKVKKGEAVGAITYTVPIE